MSDSGSSNIIMYCTFAVSTITAIIAGLNHKKIRSKCCGRIIDVSVDITNSSPLKVRSPDVEQNTRTN